MWSVKNDNNKLQNNSMIKTANDLDHPAQRRSMAMMTVVVVTTTKMNRGEEA